jgi:hypothetical protein
MRNKAIAAVLGVAAMLGMKFYNKASAHDGVKQQLVALCESDPGCQQAVETHFEACFDAAYKVGGRRRASRLEAGQLVGCLNSRSGQPYFSYDDE